MKTLNELFLLCRKHNLTLAELARETGIQKDRLYRLSHSAELASKITLQEYGKITAVFPYFVINIK